MDIELIRNNTPGVNSVTHFNNAGASLVSQQVLETQLGYLQQEAHLGGYETAALFHDQQEDFYRQVAKLINASPEEIAYTESATVSWQRAFFSIPFKKGDTILTAKAEYASNYISFLYLKEEKGVNIRIIPSNKPGEIDLGELERSIDDSVRLISLTHMPTNGGLVNPAEEVGAIAKKHGILFLLDACQSVGQYPVDVNRIGCHFLSATGRKFLRGPRGTGFLYVKRELLKHLRPINVDLHSASWTEIESYSLRDDARMFETWESNIAAKLGLAEAVKQANTLGVDLIWERVTFLANDLREKLMSLHGVEIRDLGKIKSGIVTFTTFTPAHAVKEALKKRGFNTTVAVMGSTLLDMSDRNLAEVVRASVHYYNTEEEIDKFIIALKDILETSS
ncbi:Cysteine desulfurase [Fulvivirga imtechensis AK7]|uniref:Cysteine desulfurase n=1 Tax=Fulvivirga imtechensis AK7 TaxID=1237149 RepID=L8JTW3_9BACT|nr:aminotransferase class V-fold PLP-dependent enzyme [Fulvivirga imtechensis]ELR72441.1 Cysteine desulfurase [Fulvivirga imtechensis AK7]